MRELIHRPHSVASHRPLRSSDRLDLLVPHLKTSLAQSRYFASKGTALWNELPASAHSSILSDNISSEWLYRHSMDLYRGYRPFNTILFRFGQVGVSLFSIFPAPT